MDLINRAVFKIPEIEAEAQKDACARYPEESVGVVVGDRYVPLINEAALYGMDPREAAVPERERYQSLLMAGKVRALIHSHPDGVFGPSANDMRAQERDAIPYGIIGVYKGAATGVAYWGDQLERHPLNDRVFHHGITDCYEAIRDKYFLEKKILMRQFPRDWGWWENGGDLYKDGFLSAGFYQVDGAERMPFDVLFFSSPRSKGVINHAGVYLGNDLMYHHSTYHEPFSPDHKACVAPMNNWIKYLRMVVRADENHPAIRKIS